MRLTSVLYATLVLGLTGCVRCQNSSSSSNETFDGQVDQSYFLLNSAFGILGTDTPAQALELPVGTCNEQTPCVNGACCSIVCGQSHRLCA